MPCSCCAVRSEPLDMAATCQQAHATMWSPGVSHDSYCEYTMSMACDLHTLEQCDCLVLIPNASHAAAAAVADIVGWGHVQARTQLALATVSFICGFAYVACLVMFPARLCMFPFNLALNIYICQLLPQLLLQLPLLVPWLDL